MVARWLAMNDTPKFRTGGQLIVDALMAQGTDTVFCVPGESYLDVLNALYAQQHAMRVVVCRHEGAAAFMAEAHGKLTDRPGICMVTRDPGATNASIGVHTAFQDSTPMILLIGQVGRDMIEREAFQEVDYRRMFGPFVKWVARQFVAAYSTAMRGGFLRFQAQYLRRIRLPLWADVPPPMRARLAHAAATLNLAECDRAACELYGLTPEEADLLLRD